MGLWDMFQGFGESLEDWGGGANDFGLGSINPAVGFQDSFKGLDMVGFPGPITPMGSFRKMDRSPNSWAEGLYQMYLNGNPGDDRGAWLQSLRDRAKYGDQAQPYANVEHALAGRYLTRNTAWGIGYPGLAMGAPLYQAVKLAEHNLLKPLGVPVSTTPPSWEQLWWGLRPFWGKD